MIVEAWGEYNNVVTQAQRGKELILLSSQSKGARSLAQFPLESPWNHRLNRTDSISSSVGQSGRLGHFLTRIEIVR